MSKYCKKGAIVDAFRWLPDDPLPGYKGNMDRFEDWAEAFGIEDYSVVDFNRLLVGPDVYGAGPGDWIVRESDGAIRIVDPTEFSRIFEAVS